MTFCISTQVGCAVGCSFCMTGRDGLLRQLGSAEIVAQVIERAQNGKPIYSAFFQQSSFGTFTIANERFAVKVRDDVPLEYVCALACGGPRGGLRSRPRGGLRGGQAAVARAVCEFAQVRSVRRIDSRHGASIQSRHREMWD